jgi:hypothetical protein
MSSEDYFYEFKSETFTAIKILGAFGVTYIPLWEHISQE